MQFKVHWVVSAMASTLSSDLVQWSGLSSALDLLAIIVPRTGPLGFAGSTMFMSAFLTQSSTTDSPMLRLSILTFTMEMVLKTLSGSTAPGSKITNLKSWQQITSKEDSLRLFRHTKQP